MRAIKGERTVEACNGFVLSCGLLKAVAGDVDSAVLRGMSRMHHELLIDMNSWINVNAKLRLICCQPLSVEQPVERHVSMPRIELEY